MAFNKSKVDFIAILKYRTTEEGGRTTAAISGYRPQIQFPFADMMTSSQQVFLEAAFAFPGDTVEAEITMLSPQFFTHLLSVGDEFFFREGMTIVGVGTIKQILNPTLLKDEEGK